MIEWLHVTEEVKSTTITCDINFIYSSFNLFHFIIQEAFKSIQKQILKVSVTRESSTSEKQCNLFANFEPFV